MNTQLQDIDILNYSDMMYYDQEDVIAEMLETQFRRRAMSRYNDLPRWAMFT